MAAMNSFICLPDNIVLKILSYLSNADLIRVYNVSNQFRRLCCDKSLVRYTDFEECYSLKEAMFEEYCKFAGYHIEYLNLNHCYWLTGKSVATCIKKCKNVKHLNLLDINLTAKKLVKIISGVPALRSLVFTVTNVNDFDQELLQCTEAQRVIQGIKSLTIHFKVPLALRTESSISVQFLQEKSTFFEYCRDLESFNVIGHPNLVCGLPRLLLQPNVVKTENLKNLQSISLNYAIDPAARIFYYGTLLSVAKLHLQMKTVLNPSANFETEIQPDFWNLFRKSQHQLEHLDISSISLQKVFTHVFDPGEVKPNLSFLNLSGTFRTATLITGCDLASIVSVCPRLESLNLRQSQIIFSPQSPQTIDREGIARLANCQCLSHLNLSGAHIHDSTIVETLVSNLRGLKSLSLSPCSCATQSAKDFVNSREGSGKRAWQGDDPQSDKRRRVATHGAEPVASTSSSSREHCSVESDAGVGLCGLEMLVRGSPNMTQFEMVNAGLTKPLVHRGQYGLMPKPCTYTPCPESSIMSDSWLSCISQWKHLNYLQLAGLPGIVRGTCLIAIAKGCSQLQQLHLAYLGMPGHCTFKQNLLKALPMFTALKDLRIEHGYITMDANFCKAAQSCPTLERLCIMSRGGTIDPASIISLMAYRESLTVLQLFTDATQAVCKKLQKSIKDRFASERPALSVTIWPLFDQETTGLMNNIPTKHLEELTIFCSKVCERPPGWRC